MNEHTSKAEVEVADKLAMNPEQENHLCQVIGDFARATDIKYRKGQIEHGGSLQRKATIDFMEEEILDFWTYFHVHKEHIREAVKILDDVLKEDSIESDSDNLCAYNDVLIEATRKVRGLLVIGNKEGVKEVGD